jgi:hypothetical protein
MDRRPPAPALLTITVAEAFTIWCKRYGAVACAGAVPLTLAELTLLTRADLVSGTATATDIAQLTALMELTVVALTLLFAAVGAVAGHLTAAIVRRLTRRAPIDPAEAIGLYRITATWAFPLLPFVGAMWFGPAYRLQTWVWLGNAVVLGLLSSFALKRSMLALIEHQQLADRGLLPNDRRPARAITHLERMVRVRPMRAAPSRTRAFASMLTWTWATTACGTAACGGIIFLPTILATIPAVIGGFVIGAVLGLPVALVAATVTVVRFHPLTDPAPHRRAIEGIGLATVLATLGAANLYGMIRTAVEDAGIGYRRDWTHWIEWDVWSMGISLVVAFCAARGVANLYARNWNWSAIEGSTSSRRGPARARPAAPSRG